MWGWIFVVACVSLAGAGCQGARAVVPVRLDAVALESAADPRLLTSHDAAVRGISAILVREFGLPVPDQVTVYVYGSRRMFEEGLVRDAGLSPVRAAELSATAMGVGRPRQLLFHEATPERGREWLRLVAHELTHVCQIELAGGDRGPAQWMKEGMADWVAFGVLDRLRIDSLARRREAARVTVGGAMASTPIDLEALDSPAGFSASHRSGGSARTYQLSFLMVDHLVARGGFARVVEYFRAFAASPDHGQNFEQAFGLTPAEFERAVLEDLARSRG
jgi:hypothetical protein